MASVLQSHNGQQSPSGIIATKAFVANQIKTNRIATKKTMKIHASVHDHRPGI